MKYSAKDIIKHLKMEKHYEGGYFKFLWKSDLSIPKEFLPPTFNGERKLSSVIYYLLESGDSSSWHKLLSDEHWFWHYGGTLEMTIGSGEDNPTPIKTIKIGSNILSGESFQGFVPAGMWQTTKPIGTGFVLVSCVVSPGFEDSDFFFPKTNKKGVK